MDNWNLEVFGVEKFIACVRVSPAIWDNTSADYSNKSIREAQWNNIGEVIFPKWLEITANEREEQLKEMRNKWANIRSAYHRCQTINRRNPGKRKNYIYTEHLTFLEKHLTFIDKRKPKSRLTLLNKESDEEDVKIKIEEQQVQKFEQVKLDPDNDNEDDPMEQVAVSPPHKSFERAISPSMQQQPPIRRKVVSRNRRQQSANLRRQKAQGSDPDRDFLLSMLPDYRKLSYTQKLDYRMYALGFFKHANDQTARSNGKH